MKVSFKGNSITNNSLKAPVFSAQYVIIVLLGENTIALWKVKNIHCQCNTSQIGDGRKHRFQASIGCTVCWRFLKLLPEGQRGKRSIREVVVDLHSLKWLV